MDLNDFNQASVAQAAAIATAWRFPPAAGAGGGAAFASLTALYTTAQQLALAWRGDAATGAERHPRIGEKRRARVKSRVAAGTGGDAAG